MTDEVRTETKEEAKEAPVGTERASERPAEPEGEGAGLRSPAPLGPPEAPPPEAVPSGPGVAGEIRSEAAEEVSPAAETAAEGAPGEELDPPVSVPRLMARKRGRRLVKPEERGRAGLTGEQRLLLLDSWRRSGLPAGDFADLVGVSKHTLYGWKRRFDEDGPAGLEERKRGAKGGSRVAEPVKRAILMLKDDNPAWGCERISDVLARSRGLGASAAAVRRVLGEAGYELEEVKTTPHEDHVRRFERAAPNQMWQTDLFTFVLKRQNRRVHLVAFLDDHSRYLVGFGLHATASSALVIEVLRAAIASWQAPGELLSDNGPQYVTWRGKSAFSRELETRGIRHILATPRKPRTLGKIERFWATLWQECLTGAVFVDLEEARRRIGLFIDHYNFQRPHQGIEGLVPADRFFGAAPEVLQTLKSRVAENARTLACNGIPKDPFYLTGKVGDHAFSVHAEGERVILTDPEGGRREIDLQPPARPAALPQPLCPQAAPAGDEGNEDPAAPGTSPLDDYRGRL